jgi:hypothetical protein
MERDQALPPLWIGGEPTDRARLLHGYGFCSDEQTACPA